MNPDLLIAAASGSALLGIIGSVICFITTKRVGLSVFIGTMCFILGPAIGFAI